VRGKHVFRAAWLAAIALVALQPASLAASGAPQTSTIAISVDKPGAAVPSTLYGIFFEDINFGADGGLNPERIKNRSFEFPDPLMGWKPLEGGGAKGAIYTLDRGSTSDVPNSHFLRIKVESPGGLGLSNEGFRGIGVEKGGNYNFSIDAKRVDGAPARIRVAVVSADGKRLAEGEVSGFAGDWKRLETSLTASETEPKAHLELVVDGAGTLDVDDVSLLPKATWKNRPHGLRADLVELLADMKPGFLRFPGGCIVEGSILERRYQWKTTVGDRDDRQLIVNRWNYEFKHRPTPDYYQSFDIGFYEYFQLAEDIGASPLPIINCGMACQFNTAELVPMEQLDHYIQDALDLVEFANGPVTSKWGKVRAAMGHPEPFGMKMIGVGNEQWGPQYVERYEAFAKALKAKHPEIKLVTSAGPSPDGERFEFLWAKMRELGADIVDEHYYVPPRWFPEHVNRYDDYPRTGPKVFAGEYAAQSVAIASPDNRNNWECAVNEAAFVTGLDRNSDVVVMSSYAPLFGHVDAWQWTPNLIWFDNLRSYGTPNYYVQKLFATNRGTATLPVLVDGSPKNGTSEVYSSAMWDAATGEVILKVVNLAASPRATRIDLAGAKQVAKTGRAITLASADLKGENSLDDPRRIAPVESTFDLPGTAFDYTLAPQSLTVLRVKATTK
jgi:alpha-N-arabinofuranosidase